MNSLTSPSPTTASTGGTTSTAKRSPSSPRPARCRRARVRCGSGATLTTTFSRTGLIDEVRSGTWRGRSIRSAGPSTCRSPRRSPGLVAVWALDGNANDAVGGHNGSIVGGLGFLNFPVELNCGTGSATAACLNTRFLASVQFRDPNTGVYGQGQVVAGPNPDSALFWFFAANAWEVMVKSINACSLNSRYWAFFGRDDQRLLPIDRDGRESRGEQDLLQLPGSAGAGRDGLGGVRDMPVRRSDMGSVAKRALLAGLLFLPAAAWAQPFGGWTVYTATQGNYSDVVSSPDLNPTAAITIEAWVSMSATTAQGQNCRSIIGKDYTQTYWLGVCGNTLRSYLKGSLSVRNGGTVPNGQWTHVAVTYDGVNRVHYINGEVAATFAETGALPTNTAHLRLASDVSWDYQPQGALNETRLWSVARTVEQLRGSINVPITSAQPGLVAVWPIGGPADALGGHSGVIVGTIAALTFPVAPNCGARNFDLRVPEHPVLGEHPVSGPEHGHLRPGAGGGLPEPGLRPLLVLRVQRVGGDGQVRQRLLVQQPLLGVLGGDDERLLQAGGPGRESGRAEDLLQLSGAARAGGHRHGGVRDVPPRREAPHPALPQVAPRGGSFRRRSGTRGAAPASRLDGAPRAISDRAGEVSRRGATHCSGVDPARLGDALGPAPGLRDSDSRRSGIPAPSPRSWIPRR